MTAMALLCFAVSVVSIDDPWPGPCLSNTRRARSLYEHIVQMHYRVLAQIIILTKIVVSRGTPQTRVYGLPLWGLHHTPRWPSPHTTHSRFWLWYSFRIVSVILLLCADVCFQVLVCLIYIWIFFASFGVAQKSRVLLSPTRLFRFQSIPVAPIKPIMELSSFEALVCGLLAGVFSKLCTYVCVRPNSHHLSEVYVWRLWRLTSVVLLYACHVMWTAFWYRQEKVSNIWVSVFPQGIYMQIYAHS